MAHRIEVVFRDAATDAPGRKIARRIRDDLHLPVHDVRTVSVYTLDADLSAGELAALAAGPFADPIIQDAYVDRPAAHGFAFDWLIEIGLLPGVTDNVGRTARESAETLLDRKPFSGQGVYASTQYLLSAEIDAEAVGHIARDLLANGLINRWTILPRADVTESKGVPAHVPKVEGGAVADVESIDLELSDAELLALSRAKTLALNLDEMRTIRDFYRREDIRAARALMNLPPDRPTDVELETLAQTWSEHCKHKIFAATIDYEEDGRRETIESLFKTCIQGSTAAIRRAKGAGDLCLSVFTDNAGVIRFTDDWSLVMKVETHNSPSALDPYGGALTGIVGVNRDPFGTGIGARLAFNTDVFCFASPFFEDELPPRLLHPKRVLEGVREGVEHGGNKSGIPTINGSIVFDEDFLGKPLVFCGTGGLLPATIHGKPGHEKEIRAGDLAVMAGGRIGADGIHGATFSSEELHEGSPATAVQIGDPITQKRMFDFLLIARDRGLYRSITDNGAGGLASSIGEMARSCGGCEINLDRAPLKYPGLAPWMILLSESQERMSLAVPPEKIEAFSALAAKMDVEVSVVGTFNDSGRFDVRFHDRIVASLPMDFLHDGVPVMRLAARWTPPALAKRFEREKEDYGATLRGLLARLNICSKEYVVRQYDHEVQAGSAVKPMCGANADGPSDAAVWRPLLDRMDAAVVSHGLVPRYSRIDAYDMASCAIDEAVRNAVATGADPDRMAGLDNFCWCDPVKTDANPDGDYKLAQLVRANRAVYDVTVAYGVPCVSGKDSMKNDYINAGQKISIPPTLLFTVVGVIPDAGKAVTMDVKAAGDLVYVLGTTRAELGASEYQQHHGDALSADVPRVDTDANLALYRALHRAMGAGLVRSCHDCSDGGLAVALAESAFAGGFGMRVDLTGASIDGETLSPAEMLFAESAGRFVATVAPENAEAFEAALASCAIARVGEVTNSTRLVARYGDEIRVDEDINDLRAAFKATLDF
ncbi:phosphoribosylformylglycinamidine synthase [bacterium]|nr:phosphoribosylformylglycinamidine synthase [bacterium]